MSHDVLAELRRRLVGLSSTPRADRRTPRDDRRRNEGARDAPGAPEPLATDGGERDERDDDEHLRDLPDGAGCTEIWEHLSERHAEEGGATEPGAVECRADD